MMRRTEPLVVDVFVTALAGLRLHEKLAGNFLLAVDLRRTGEERTLGAVAFAIHVVGRHGGILDAAARLPAFANVARAEAEGSEHEEAYYDAEGGYGNAAGAASHATGNQKSDASQRNHDVYIKLVPLRARSAGLNQNQAENSSGGN